MGKKVYAFDFNDDFDVAGKHQFFRMQDLTAIGGGFKSTLPGAGTWTSSSGWIEVWGDQLVKPTSGGKQINLTGRPRGRTRRLGGQRAQ